MVEKHLAVVVRGELNDLKLNASKVIDCEYVVQVFQDKPAVCSRLAGLMKSSRFGRLNIVIQQGTSVELPSFTITSSSKNRVSYQDLVYNNALA